MLLPWAYFTSGTGCKDPTPRRGLETCICHLLPRRATLPTFPLRIPPGQSHLSLPAAHLPPLPESFPLSGASLDSHLGLSLQTLRLAKYTLPSAAVPTFSCLPSSLPSPPPLTHGS